MDRAVGWNNRILVDTANVFAYSSGTPVPVDLGDQTGSEITAAHAPGARVIKAFNTLYAKYIEPDPRHDVGRQVVVYAGDDVEAKGTFDALLVVPGQKRLRRHRSRRARARASPRTRPTKRGCR